MDNCSGQDVDRSVLEDFGFLVAFIGGLSLSLNVPTIVVLYTARAAIAKGLRMYLISTLVSAILKSIYKHYSHQSDCLCDSILWCPNSTSSFLPLLYMGGQFWSVSKVLYCCFFHIGLACCAIRKEHEGNVHHSFFVLCLGHILTSFHPISSTSGVCSEFLCRCSPVEDDTIFLDARLLFTVFLLMMTTFLLLSVRIVVPIVVISYTKKHSITGDNNYGKDAAKLGVYLLTGSQLNSTGCIVAGVLTYFTTGAAIIYFAFVTRLLSLYPTLIYTCHHISETSTWQTEDMSKV